MRRSLWVLGAIVALLALAELFARFYLGLGEPPLSQFHPTMAYLFKPNQKVHRFGRLFQTNRYGMRSDDFLPQKSDPREIRILVFGNSVINGGSPTDQSGLATTIVHRTLTQELGRPVVVGNVSAGNWGPPNHLAFLNQYGLLDADIVVLVWSSSDYDNAPNFRPLDPLIRPTEAPVLALWEALTRYLPRYFNGNNVNEAGVIPDPEHLPNKRDIEVSQSAEREIFEMAKAHSVKALLIQHWTSSELQARKSLKGYAGIRDLAVQASVPIHDDADELREFVAAGKNPYRDDIHLNENGQQALAKILLSALKSDFPDVVAPQKPWRESMKRTESRPQN